MHPFPLYLGTTCRYPTPTANQCGEGGRIGSRLNVCMYSRIQGRPRSIEQYSGRYGLYGFVWLNGLYGSLSLAIWCMGWRFEMDNQPPLAIPYSAEGRKAVQKEPTNRQTDA